MANPFVVVVCLQLDTYATEKTYTLKAPNKTTSELFVNCKGDGKCRGSNAVTYTISFQAAGNKTSTDPPGKFFIANSGEILAQITKTRIGRYTGVLKARDSGMSELVVKRWTFGVEQQCPIGQIRLDGSECEVCNLHCCLNS